MGIEAKSEEIEVIHAYTRAQAIEDGVLVDLSRLAREAGSGGLWRSREPCGP